MRYQVKRGDRSIAGNTALISLISKGLPNVRLVILVDIQKVVEEVAVSWETAKAVINWLVIAT